MENFGGLHKDTLVEVQSKQYQDDEKIGFVAKGGLYLNILILLISIAGLILSISS